MRTVGVGIVGTGVGLRTHFPAFSGTVGARVVGIVGSKLARAQIYAEKFSGVTAVDSVDALCLNPDVDIIVVASPNEFRVPHVSSVVSSGKSFLLEKPLGSTAAEAATIAEMLIGYSSIHLVNHQLRFNPYIRKIRDIVRSGRLGQVYSLQIFQQSIGFSDRNAPWSWSFDSFAGGGVRLAMASHLIDLSRFLLSSANVFGISAMMDPVVTMRPGPDGQQREISASSFFSASIQMSHHCCVSLMATAAAFGEAGFEIAVHGDDGELRFDLVKKLRGAFRDSRGRFHSIDVEGVSERERRNEVSIFSGSEPYLAACLIDAIREDDRGLIADAATISDALHTQSVLEAMLESSVTGLTVKLASGYQTRASI